MADLSDVESAIVAAINSALYPSGGTGASITGDVVKIYPGWPNSAQLDSDIAANIANVSVFNLPGMGRNTTRYRREEQVVAQPVHTLTAAVSGNQVTIGGTVSTPQNVIVLCGPKLAFPYAVQAGDTLASISTALAAMIAVSFPGTASVGPVITVTGAPGLIRARIAGQGQVYTEQRRQEITFDVSVWAASPAQRTAVAKVVDLALAEIDWLTLADQGAARIQYAGSADSDEAQKSTIYRRSLRYMVEYATASIAPAYEIGTVEVTVTGGQSPDGTPQDVVGGSVQTNY